jgi:phasin family protein
MSETTKIADAARKAQDTTARSTSMAGDRPAGDMASKSVKDSASSTEPMADAAAEQAKYAGRTFQAAAEAGARTASAASNGARIGLNATAEAGGRMADASYDQGRRLLASTAHAMDIYNGATERSAERVQALMYSALTLSRGLRKMQHAWLEILDHSMEHAVHRPQDLLRCKSLTEIAEVQCDLYTDAINHAFESSSRLLELASRTAEEAVRPLRSQMH